MLNQVSQKRYNTDWDEIILIFTDQIGAPLEIEDKFNLTLLINQQKSHPLRAQKYNDAVQNQEEEKMLKEVYFSELQENMKNNH